MINAPSVALQRKSCITSSLHACVKLLENILFFGWFELVKHIAVSVKDIILGLPNRTDIINNLTSSNL